MPVVAGLFRKGLISGTAFVELEVLLGPEKKGLFSLLVT